MAQPHHVLNLESCPKVYMHETHRSRTPEATLQFIERTREILGIRSLGEATDADRVGVPVFTCERKRPDDSTVTHTGKGLSRLQAEVSLLMEAAERHGSEFRDEYLFRLIEGSFRVLQHDHSILDPSELVLPQFAPDLREVPVHWARGYDLLGKEAVLVPACAVYHPFTLDPVGLIATNTNGLAAGNTLEEAIFHGMTEVIERDAWSIARFRGSMDTPLAVEEAPGNEFLLDCVERFQATNIEIVAKDITTDLGVPVIAAFSVDLEHPSTIPIDGFGAHLDPRVAMARALMEVASTRAFLMERHGILRLREGSSYLDAEGQFHDARFHARVCKPLSSLTSSSSTDIPTDIEIIMGKLQEKGFKRVIVVDLTRPDVNVPTVRVIIPGMEVYCFDRSRRGGRLYAHEKDAP